MNLVKLIPYRTRERIRKILFGKNHFHDIMEFAQLMGVKTMFDVGAQRGYETILAAKGGIEVAAFEPDKSAFYALKRNVTAEGVEDMVYAMRTAVSDSCTPGEEVFTITIRAFSNLADLIGQANAAGRPDFLKIDTDGDDINVLNGYPFDKHRPMLLSVEYDASGAVDRKLLSEGYLLIYAIYKPQTRARRAIFSRYSLSPEFYGGEWGDVIAVLPQHYVALRDKLFDF